MSKVEPEALPREAAELLAAERGRPGPTGDVSARVWSRLEGSIAAGALPPPGADGPSFSASAPPAPGAVAGTAAGPALKLISVALAPATVVALTVGSGIWMDHEKEKAAAPANRPAVEVYPSAHGPGETPKVTAPLVDEPPAVAADPSATPAGVEDPPAPRISPTPSPRGKVGRPQPRATARSPVASRTPTSAPPMAPTPGVPPAVPEEASQPSDNDSLAAERAILEAARRALLAGNAEGAQGMLARHARLFQPGRLAEQRESLWIQALAAAGEVARARERLTAFRKHFPRSIFLPVLDAALPEPDTR